MKTIRILLFLLILSTAAWAAADYDLDLPSSYDSRFDGASTGDFLGDAVAVGYIDDNEELDLVLGAFAESNNGNQSGSVYIILNPYSKGITGNIDLGTYYDARFDGAAAQDQLGSSVACGDLDGDGYDDIIMGAFQADNNGNNSGSTYVKWGSDSLSGIYSLTLEASYDLRFDGANADASLGSSEAMGDIDGDGKQDLIMGARADGAGRAYLVFGKLRADFTTKNMPLSTSTYYDAQFVGAVEQDRFGSSMACGEDVNGNGFGDILIGAYWADNNTRDKSGSVYLISGESRANFVANKDRLMTTTSNYLARFDGDEAGDELGNPRSLAMGDIITGGDAELILGAHQSRNGSGRVYIITARTYTSEAIDLSDSDNYTVRFYGYQEDSGSNPGSMLGSSVKMGAHSGADLILGGAYNDKSSEVQDSGVVYLISQGTYSGNLSAHLSASLSFDGAKTGDSLGYSVAGGDWDADGQTDPVMGAVYADNNSRNFSGSVYVYTGAAQPVVSSVDPSSKKQGWIGVFEISGRNLANVSSIAFIDPSTDAVDSKIEVYKIPAKSANSVKAIISVSPEAVAGTRDVRVATSNGTVLRGRGIGKFSVSAKTDGPTFSGIKFVYYDPSGSQQEISYTIGSGSITISDIDYSRELRIQGTIQDTYPGLSSDTINFSIVSGTNFYERTATVSGGIATFNETISVIGSQIVLYAEDTDANPGRETITIIMPTSLGRENKGILSTLSHGDKLQIIYDRSLVKQVNKATFFGANPTPTVVNFRNTQPKSMRSMGVRSADADVQVVTQTIPSSIARGPFQVLLTIVELEDQDGNIQRVKMGKHFVYY